MAVRIKAGMEKVPGGLMLVPLLVGAVIHTAAPDAGKFFGSFTGAMFTGLAPILGVFYVCLGATLDLKATPYIAKKGGALLGSKIAFAAVVGIVLGRLWGGYRSRAGCWPVCRCWRWWRRSTTPTAGCTSR